MSQATIRGIPPNSWIPGPDFVFQRDTTGKVTGSQSFTANRQEFYGQIMQSAFRKGAKINTVYPQVVAFLNPLEIDIAECQEQPGGLDKIFVTYVGYIEVNSELQDRETVYSRNNALEERSTMEHPKFLAEVENAQDIQTIQKGYDGLAKKSFRSDGSTYYIVDAVTDQQINTLTDETVRYWWNKIVEQGWRTYQAATSEWTKTRSNAGGLQNSDIANMGKIDTPDGNPATPPEKVWFMSGSTESRAVGSAASYSITWTLIDDNEKNQKLYGDE
jgi:hypothetical protein